MKTSIDSFIDTVGSMMIATESSELSEISTFVENPSNYLEVSYRNGKFSNPNVTFTSTLSTEGMLYNSVVKACDELINVQAYTEAMLIYSCMIDRMTELLDDVDEDEQENLKWSIDEMKTALLKTMKQRDDYTSIRKSIISKYSVLVDKLQN